MEKKIKKVAFICDGGMGSSAMGAALFRRMLKEEGVTEVEVRAYAADLVPEHMDMLVCQKYFWRSLPGKLKEREIFLLDNLVSKEAYRELVREIQKRNG